MKEKKCLHQKQMKPLWDLCDDIRTDLLHQGFTIQVNTGGIVYLRWGVSYIDSIFF